MKRYRLWVLCTATSALLLLLAATAWAQGLWPGLPFATSATVQICTTVPAETLANLGIAPVWDPAISGLTLRQTGATATDPTTLDARVKGLEADLAKALQQRDAAQARVRELEAQVAPKPASPTPSLPSTPLPAPKASPPSSMSPTAPTATTAPAAPVTTAAPPTQATSASTAWAFAPADPYKVVLLAPRPATIVGDGSSVATVIARVTDIFGNQVQVPGRFTFITNDNRFVFLPGAAADGSLTQRSADGQFTALLQSQIVQSTGTAIITVAFVPGDISVSLAGGATATTELTVTPVQ